MRIAVGIGVLVVTSLGLASVVGTDSCTAAAPHLWLSRAEIEARLRTAGLRPMILRAESDQCLSAIVRDETGALRALVVSPLDGRIVRAVEMR